MKTSLFLILSLVASVDAMADNRERISTSTHGVGLPYEVGTRAEGEAYRARYMRQEGIQSYQKYGVEFFRNNQRGLGLVKANNTDEPAFMNILKGIQKITTWRNGDSFIEAMEDYTSRYGCIPKITSTSHGWISPDELGEVHGLSGWNGLNGIYTRESQRPTGFGKFGSRTLEEHMAKSINQGKIKFCGTCIVQIYACNVSAEFANVFARLSGCQTVVGTGQGSPYFRSYETQEDRNLTTTAFHHWSSAAAVWEERGRVGFHRATPVKNSRGQVTNLVLENLGTHYIAL